MQKLRYTYILPRGSQSRGTAPWCPWCRVQGTPCVWCVRCLVTLHKTKSRSRAVAKLDPCCVARKRRGMARCIFSTARDRSSSLHTGFASGVGTRCGEARDVWFDLDRGKTFRTRPKPPTSPAKRAVWGVGTAIIAVVRRHASRPHCWRLHWTTGWPGKRNDWSLFLLNFEF